MYTNSESFFFMFVTLVVIDSFEPTNSVMCVFWQCGGETNEVNTTVELHANVSDPSDIVHVKSYCVYSTYYTLLRKANTVSHGELKRLHFALNESALITSKKTHRKSNSCTNFKPTTNMLLSSREVGKDESKRKRRETRLKTS